VCAVCGQQFQNGKYFEHENKAYCEEHFYALSSEKCAQCGRGIKEQELVRVQGKVYHSGCLSCHFCGISLTGNNKSIFSKENNVYCREDYLNLFVKRCTACADFILKQVSTAFRRRAPPSARRAPPPPVAPFRGILRNLLMSACLFSAAYRSACK
jgi:hypothetical protein